jgi:transcriptional regulator CtsR
VSNGNKYILFKGGLQPKSPMAATDSKLKELSSVGYKQGQHYDIVPLKIILDSRKTKKKGGKIKSKYSKGGGVRTAKYKV